MARSSLAWRRGSISPISSSSRVPPSACSNLPLRAAIGAAEGALLVAEQLAFQQALRQRRAVQRDEGAARAPAEGVDVARQHLLAGAALAGDEHAGLRRGRAAPPAPAPPPWPGRGGPALRGARRPPLPAWRRSGRHRAAAAGSPWRRRGWRAPRPRRRRRARRRSTGQAMRSCCQPLHQPGHVVRQRRRAPGRRPPPAAAPRPAETPSACASRAPRALRHARRLAEFGVQRADDEDPCHGRQPTRSALTISVIVTPSRLSSTITTSPRATRRLLT